MDDRPNPFKPGAGLEPPYLSGREAELDLFDDLLRCVRRGAAKNMLLYGLRGVGKTVLLKKFASVSRSQKFLPIVEYQFGSKESDPSEFVASIKQAMRLAIESSSRAEAAKGKTRLAGERLKPPAVGVPGPVHYGPPSAHGREETPRFHLTNYLAKNWEVVDGLGYEGAVFLLDEFHTVKDVKKNGWYALADFVGAVNTVQGNGCKYSLVLSGLPALRKNIKTARSYGERMFGSVELSNISIENAKLAILNPLKDTDCELSPRLVESIAEDSGEYPYFIQFFACEVLRRIDKTRIGMVDYASVKDSIVQKLHRDFFDQRIADLSPGEKTTLYHMSKMPEGNMQFSSILTSLKCNKGLLSSRLGRLEKKGLIYRHNHGNYKFALPLLKSCLLDAGPEKIR